MPTHAEVKALPHTPEQLFDLVADVECYHEFLPWCISCDIIERADKNTFYADLVIGYKMFREKFRSKVTLIPKKEIRVEYLRGPLKNLSNVWKFEKNKDGTCTIDFYVDFEFKNPVFKSLMGVFFQEIIRRMVSAFEVRANVLYS